MRCSRGRAGAPLSPWYREVRPEGKLKLSSFIFARVVVVRRW